MELKLKTAKKDALPVLCGPADIKALADTRRLRVVLAPALSLCAMQPLPAQEGFVPQPARSAGGRFPWQRSETKMLYSSIAKDAVASLAKGSHKVVLAHEVLMRYGRRLPRADEHLVLGVFEGLQQCTALAFVFRKGELAELVSASLPPPGSPEHDSDLQLMAERLRSRYAQAQAHWLGPLSIPRALDFKPAPATLWASAPAQRVAVSGKPGPWRKFGAAALLVLLSALGSVAAVWVPYEKYQHAVHELGTESQALQGQYQFASDRLQQLRARQAFFEISSRGQKRLQHFETVLQVAAAEPSLRVISSRMNAAADPTAANESGRADFELLVQVPRQPDATALAQSLVLLQKLSQAAGMPMRLATQDGHREIPGSSEPARQYRIQGDFPRAE